MAEQDKNFEFLRQFDVSLYLLIIAGISIFISYIATLDDRDKLVCGITQEECDIPDTFPLRLVSRGMSIAVLFGFLVLDYKNQITNMEDDELGLFFSLVLFVIAVVEFSRLLKSKVDENAEQRAPDFDEPAEAELDIIEPGTTTAESSSAITSAFVYHGR